MTGIVYATWEGGDQTATKDKKSTQELEVIYDGDDDSQIASSAISSWLPANVPDTYAAGGQLKLLRFGPVKRLAPGVFKASATYGDPEDSRRTDPPALGEFKISWDISSATFKQKFSPAGKFTRYLDPAYADPNPHGAIGLKKANNGKLSVEGVDRRYGAMKFSVNFRVPHTTVSGAYVETLREKAFHVNDAPFLGFAKRQLLFVGSSGSQSVFGDPELKHDFETDTEETISSLGSIPTITKPPHDYLDVVYDTEADNTNKVIIAKPIAAYVHRMYEETSFPALFGFGP